MHEAVAVWAPNSKPLTRRITVARAVIPTLAEASLAAGSALLLILTFPNFDLWPLAWFGLVPLLATVAQARKPSRAFVLGLIWGTIFFYGTCWWLTHSMIHYGHLRGWLAFVLLSLPVVLVAVFPALSCAFVAWIVSRFGAIGLLAAPFIWISTEGLRYIVTGQVWNTIGYSQAFHPSLVQTASWGGVYAVSFLILAINAAITYALMRRSIASAVGSLSALVVLAVLATVAFGTRRPPPAAGNGPYTLVVAVQPNVPMEQMDDGTFQHLLDRHFELTRQALKAAGATSATQRVVIWPESPMNFSYAGDPHLREIVGDFARTNRATIMLNSLEPAPNGGGYNSAIVVNEKGEKAGQYDKIRLMPFGEYVPLPRWLPGASSVRGIVGEFTPGSSYTLMPLGAFRAGVFICIEAAHPSIARTFTKDGADLLVNISNDGYLGPTAVMKQHLANAIFRAVENGRPLLRVTNTGISAYIDSQGRVLDRTSGFESTVRSWTIRNEATGTTFYTRHGDLFLLMCVMISLGLIAATFASRRKAISDSVAGTRS